jgi:Na+-transporting methylmalonyl-CoA/oxaloacetate decarboxylase gamma subunit
MTIADALTVTALGMAVVFSGLLLTALLIVVFGRVAQLLDAPSRSEAQASSPSPATTGPELAPEILTVITTVLEIERRLNRLGASRREMDHD